MNKQFFSNLGSTFKGSKGIIAFVILVVVAVLAWNYFQKPVVVPTTSTVKGGAMSQTTIQGTDKPISQDYSDALKQADQQRIEQAKKENASAMPTIQNTTMAQQAPLLPLDPPVDKTPKVDVPETKIEQKPLVVATQQPGAQDVPLVTSPPPAPIVVNKEQADALVKYMTPRRLPPAAVVDFGYTAPAVVASEQSAPAATGQTSATASSKIKLPLAGTILYAQMVSRANSDHPGPVLAKVLQGEYSGATLIGTFQNSNGALTINFTQMTVGTTRSGEEINETAAINAVAVDTKYIGTGLATDVDRHLFQKLAIAFTSSFAQGFGKAVSNTGSTTINSTTGSVTTSNGNLSTREELLSAGGQAIGSAGNIMQQEFGNVPTTVIVETGTPIGVLFLK